MKKNFKNGLTATVLSVALLLGYAACSFGADQSEKTALSSPDFNLDAEYYYATYNLWAKKNGNSAVFENRDIVVHALTFDQLPYLLQQEGNYLVLFGGVHNDNVRAAIPYINEYAKAYGIRDVYNFDFRLDGESEATDIENLTDETKNPYGKTVSADEYNYLYGELVERYLSNLDDWAAITSKTADAVKWKHVDAKTHSNTARLKEPFLFLYNKDNTRRNVVGADGKLNSADDGKTKYPIVYALDGFTPNYKKDVQSVFHYIFEQKLKLSSYSDGNYFADALIEDNIRGHAPKLYDIFDRNEQINLNAINYSQLRWLLQQSGDAIILIAGAWCANSTAAFGPINDYAVANNLQIYVFDDRLDGKHPIDFWGYNRDRQFKSRDSRIPGIEGAFNPNAYLYVDLVNQFLPNMEITGKHSIVYLDERNDTIKAPASQSPYLFIYNKDAVSPQGKAAPIVDWYEKMLEVTEKNLRPESYLYIPENYREYTNGIRRILEKYAKHTGIAKIFDPKEPRRKLIDIKYIDVKPYEPYNPLRGFGDDNRNTGTQQR